ncbi:uncharacterized protein BO66DRAFT_471757 [Aspergillus aculeatinus CBS 121060]|uniref:Uncharacterized protein n=1 Tax=Aspergillus aculeatinus CBS 121060 TaxID=1448322 RepID=A0ACD1H861_9EURO|nr:hypothetical protein BO66DRAFT_471757 [Aspergillus aculeatinus CBS 121060]RAH69828.1 hypothetical protein BO66DRAFT_471757 [Aspergillus aculeatinus CBS 121060]
MANSNTGTKAISACLDKTKRVGRDVIFKLVGWFVWLFGDRSISKTRYRLLCCNDDAKTEAFRKTLLNDNRLLATSGSMMTASSVALLSHASASQTHPATHCFLLFGVVFSMIAVQHALNQSRVLSLLVKPSDLRAWLRAGTLRGDRNNTETNTNNSSTTESRGQGLSGQPSSQQSLDRAEAGGTQGSDGKEESGASATSIPGALSSFAFHSVMVGCVVHLGTVRSPDDKTSPPLRNRPQFIAFIIALGIGYLLHKCYSVGLPTEYTNPRVGRHRIKPTMFTAEAERSNASQAITRRGSRLNMFGHPILARKDE